MIRRFAACAALATLGFAGASQATDPGRELFAKGTTPACALCHTLADASATANVGPSLDELKPDAERVIKAVKEGIGAMPAYPSLSEEQVQTLARYVARTSGGAK